MLGLLGRIGAANPFSLLAVMWGVGLLETVKVALYLLMGVVLMSAILSWVNPHAPMAGVINALAEPFCARSGASSRSSAAST
jgi:YggT family protein